MKKKPRKIISIFLLFSLIVTSNSFMSAAEVVGAISVESVTSTDNLATATISEAKKKTSEATPSEAVRPVEMDDEDISKATPTEATPSEATPSNATPIENVEFKFVRPDKSDIPDYYKRENSNKIFYTFTDRNNTKQYRIYGYYEDSSIVDWYECNENGEVDSSCQFIDLDWEDYNQAPYRFESTLASQSVFKELSETLFYDEDAIFEYTSEITVEEPFGQNYDGTCYDVWHIYSDSEPEDEELQEDLDIYYMYGHIVNTYSSDLSQDKWFEVSEDGEVIVEETVSISFLFTSLLMAVMPQTYSLPGNMEVYVRSWSEGPDRANLKYTSTNFYKNWSSNIKSSENSTKQINGLILSSYSSGYKSETVSYTQKNNDFICFYLVNHGESASGRGTAEGNMRLYAPDGTLVYEATRSEGIYGVFIMVYLDGSANGQWRIETDSYSYYSESEETKEGWEDVWGGVKYINISGLSYTVNYNGNGATGGSTGSSSHTNGTASPLTTNGYTRTYYSFKNWNTKADGSGTSYSNGQSVSSIDLDLTSGGTVTLYAQWKRTSSVVTFKDWNGTVLKTQEVSNGAAATPPSNPLRSGYTFTGWDKTYTNITDHTTVTAKYAANTYTIAYHGNEATGGSTASSTHSYDTAKTLTANGFTRTYYTFKNWNTKADGSGTSYSNSQSVSNLTASQGATITLYAQWTRSSSVVIFKDWNGTVLKTQEVSNGAAATPPSNPLRSGYTFTGWDKAYTNITDHTTVTAKYAANTYTIAYYGNEATGGSTASSTHSYDTAKTLTENGFTRTYYTFRNWNTMADGSGTSYSNSQSISNLTAIQGVTIPLYAQWTRSSSLVTFLDWNGTALKTQVVAVGASATLPLNPARTGYTFTGWDKSPFNIQDHTTITAQYLINNYTLALNGNGGTVDGSLSKVESITYQDSFDQQLKDGRDAAVRTGFTFGGWYSEESGGSDYSYSGNTMPAAAVTVYAHWIPNTYEVRFDPDHVRWTGGIFQEDHIFDTKLGTLPAPEIYGWVFLGWRTGQNGAGEAVTEQSGVEPQNVTYYGSWEPGTYRIRYLSEAEHQSGKSVQTFTADQVYDSALGTLPQPEEPGYTFTGWYDGSEKVTPETVFSPVSDAEGHIYHARWEANTYHIRLLGNHYGLDQVISEFDRTYYTRIGDLPEPEAPGYTFLGWFDETGNEITAESWVEFQNADYLAHWQVNQYTVSFDKNLYAVEENPKDKTVTYDEVLGELPVLSANGYTFMGWYTDPEGGERVEEETPVAIGDQTYYAHWKQNLYILKLTTDKSVSLIKELTVIYDGVLGTLPVPELEDFSFRGWYLKPYSDTAATPSEAKYQESIYLDTATPSEALRIDESTVYQTATSSEAYAYFDLVYQEEDGNKNRRSGIDGILGTEDDNFYFNGQDQTAGTTDDRKINRGTDGMYGTIDDYYEFDGGRVYPGPDGIFGTHDDYLDLFNGTNLRPQDAPWWNDTGTLLVDNGYDGKPGTRDDWIWESKIQNTIRRSGPDAIFYTGDDEIWWIGADGIPGTEDDQLIQKGLDGKYGTADDFIDNEDGTNTRAGADGIWGTEDDELWWNGPDGIPGTADDQLIQKGLDDKYGTADDFIDNEDGTNTRPGSDGIWGTEDDELWWNGPDGIPGTADDRLIHKGMDGKYGTSDDFIDNEDGTNTRSGSDGIWGTEDDELWWNGPDAIPGNADDQLIQKGMDGKYGTADDFIDNGDGTNTRPGPDLIWGTEDDEIWLNGSDDLPGTADDKLKVSESNIISDNIITQQVTVIPMYPSIVHNNNNDDDDDDDDGIVDNNITPQTIALKKSNYEGLGGGVWEDLTIFLPNENKETYKKNEIVHQLSIKDGNDNNTTFWTKLFTWFKENKKDVLAVLLLFLAGLVVLFEVSRRNYTKDKSAKLPKTDLFKTKISDINMSKKRWYSNRN